MPMSLLCLCQKVLCVCLQINGAPDSDALKEVAQSDLAADVFQRCGITQVLKVCLYKQHFLGPLLKLNSLDIANEGLHTY